MPQFLKLPVFLRWSFVSTSQLYQYQKLETPSTLRLIQVLPDLEDGRIVCEIRLVDPESSQGLEYHALSYHWGDPTLTREIYIKDFSSPQKHLHPLHENLWQFLREIRRQTLVGIADFGGCLQFAQETRAPLLIWTDSLCLNQRDAEEIKQQVPRMGIIYSRATCVLIWLGTNTRVEAELKCLRDCDDELSLYKALGVTSPYGSGGNKWPGISLLELEYWNRAWIVQEIVLAAQARVMAGEVAMDFSRLEMMIQKPMMHGGEKLYRLHWISTFREDERNGRSKPLIRLVVLAEGCKATKPADVVYGLLGLVGDNRDGTSPREHITVDYTKRLVDVLFDTVFEARGGFTGYMLFLWVLDASLQGKNRLKKHKRIIDRPLVLETYLNGKSISDRHHRLAELALRVYKAMIILSHSLRYDERMYAGVKHFEQPKFLRDQNKITVQQHAAVVGFILAHCAGVPRIWRRKKLWQKSLSPWRCAAHWSKHHYPSTEPNGLWEESKYDMKDKLKTVCGERGKLCDGSELAFEIPEIGFRVVVSPPGSMKASMFDLSVM